MSFKLFVSTAAVAAAFCVCAPAMAQDTAQHVIPTNFPDAFKLRSHSVSDTTMAMTPASDSTPKASHVESAVVLDVHKDGDGYKAVYNVQKTDAVTTGDTNPAGMVNAMADVDAFQVTFDHNFNPVSVDNIEAIKAEVHHLMVDKPDSDHPMIDASANNDKANVQKLYDLVFGDMTPQSAAALLRVTRQQTDFYNRPMVLGTPVTVTGEPLQIMGGSLPLGGTMTLTRWDEGKSAHVTYVITPSPDDLRGFAGTVMTKLVDAVASANPDASQGLAVFGRLVDNMQISATVTCDTDVDLTNTLLTHTVCDTNGRVDIDLSTLIPPEQLKANPDAAKNLPKLAMTLVGHQVQDTTMEPLAAVATN